MQKICILNLKSGFESQLKKILGNHVLLTYEELK